MAVIGAGFSGLGASIRLNITGSPSFIIFEKVADIGGTWRDNTDPSCVCDIPSFLHSYPFEVNPEWTKTFSSKLVVKALLPIHLYY